MPDGFKKTQNGYSYDTFDIDVPKGGIGWHGVYSYGRLLRHCDTLDEAKDLCRAERQVQLDNDAAEARWGGQ